MYLAEALQCRDSVTLTFKRLTFKWWEFRIRNKTTYMGKGGSSVYGTTPKRQRKMM